MAKDAELRVHREWIGAIQPIGLVVSAPALVSAQAFPDQNTLEKRAALLALVKPRRPNETDKEHAKRKPLAVRFPALAEAVLGWKPGKLVGAPEGLSVILPAFHETLRPTWAVRALPEDEGEWMMLVLELPDGIAFDEAPEETSKKWHASPQVRLERLLKETGVPIGVLSNGFAVRLVYAPRGETSGHATWPLPPLTQASHKDGLAALTMLLGAARLFQLGREQRLPHILKESRKYQNVVSTKLAGQVLEALNELLRGFQAANDKAKGGLLDRTVREQAEHVYGGLLAVLLRLVFVLYAEERGMLSSSAVYVRNYSLVGLFEKLRVDQGRFPDTMDDRYGAWSRLLVLFRMVHDGAKHGDMKLPERYGELFDPNKWGFLEGRPYKIGRVKGERVEVPKVSDGVVYRVLEKLLLLEGERLSYRALDVEQIGSVYENMMGFRVESAAETSIGVGKDHVVIGLDTLLGKKGSEREKYLKDAAGVELSGKAVDALKQAASMDDLVAALSRRISPLTPRTIPAGGIYLQPTDERRRSGSHYTPRELTEPIVRTTLRPVLEALGESPTPESLLALKVCDPAMGSGAFLVEACRQLGLALVAAWQAHNKIPEIPPDEDQELHARRLIAQKCIYGVDKNPFAVELAKLSIWLVTLAKEHPLTFVDHALREGDSLVGLSSEQIYNLAFDPVKGSKMLPQARNLLFNKVRQAETLRGQLHALGDSDNTPEKRRLLNDADGALDDVRLIGDAMVASFFAHGSDKDRKKALENLVAKMPGWVQKREFDDELRKAVWELRNADKAVKPFHWEIEFPEVFARVRQGFDCMVGNPPFLGGKLISSAYTPPYERALKFLYSDSKGAADIVAYFFRRCFEIAGQKATCGLLATHSVAETATRAVGLEVILRDGALIFDAWTDLPWPGDAMVTVCRVVFSKGHGERSRFLNGQEVATISSALKAGLDYSQNLRLTHGVSYSEGTKLFGEAFVVSESEVESLCRKNPGLRNYLRPFVNGDVLNLTPNAYDGRWVADFGELEREQIHGCDEFLGVLMPAIAHERRNQVRQVHETRPWLHWDKRTRFFQRTRCLRRIIACATPSRFLSFLFVDPSKLYTHSVKLFGDDRSSLLCVLQSRIHELWAVGVSSNFGKSVRYSTSTSFDTFALPAFLESNRLSDAGEAYAEHRQACLSSRGVGPTVLYGLFHDEGDESEDLVRLRRLHAKMDEAVLDAYGWSDIRGEAGFVLLDGNKVLEGDLEEQAGDAHRRKARHRYGWSDDVCDNVRARLIKLNADRARAGAAVATSSAVPKSQSKRALEPIADQGDLFGDKDKS